MNQDGDIPFLGTPRDFLLPTVPHNDFGWLNFKGLTSNYLLLMTLPPADDDKMKKKSYFRYPNFEKDLGFCILVESLPYKGEVRNSKFEKLIGLWAGK